MATSAIGVKMYKHMSFKVAMNVLAKPQKIGRSADFWAKSARQDSRVLHSLFDIQGKRRLLPEL